MKPIINLLTLREVAEAVKVSESTVRRWVRSRELSAYKVGKRGQLRFRVEDLEAFLERQKVGGDDDGLPPQGVGQRRKGSP